MTNDEVKQYIADHPDYQVCGACKYLGIESYQSNIAEKMFSLLDKLSPCEDSRALKPVYLKD